MYSGESRGDSTKSDKIRHAILCKETKCDIIILLMRTMCTKRNAGQGHAPGCVPMGTQMCSDIVRRERVNIMKRITRFGRGWSALLPALVVCWGMLGAAALAEESPDGTPAQVTQEELWAQLEAGGSVTVASDITLAEGRIVRLSQNLDLTIGEGVTLTVTEPIEVPEGVVLNINGGTLNTLGAIRVQRGGAVNLNGGCTVNGYENALRLEGGDATVNNGTLVCGENTGYQTVDICGGTFVLKNGLVKNVTDSYDIWTITDMGAIKASQSDSVVRIEGGQVLNEGDGAAALLLDGGAKADISGGRVEDTGESSAAICCMGADAAIQISGGVIGSEWGSALQFENADCTVIGGTFFGEDVYEVLQWCLPEGYQLGEDKTVTFTAEAKARIGERCFVSLDSAVSAAVAGDTVVLTQDTALTETLVLGELTLDLNGKRLYLDTGERSGLRLDRDAAVTGGVSEKGGIRYDGSGDGIEIAGGANVLSNLIVEAAGTARAGVRICGETTCGTVKNCEITGGIWAVEVAEGPVAVTIDSTTLSGGEGLIVSEGEARVTALNTNAVCSAVADGGRTVCFASYAQALEKGSAITVLETSADPGTVVMMPGQTISAAGRDIAGSLSVPGGYQMNTDAETVDGVIVYTYTLVPLASGPALPETKPETPPPVIRYTVAFDGGGGETPEPIVVQAGACADLPVPQRAGPYRFEGWFLNGVLWTEETPVTGDITLTAAWSRTDSPRPGGGSRPVVRPDVPVETSTPRPPFLDVSESAWFWDAVTYVYANSLMDGTDAAAFSPDLPCSRAMLVKVLHNLRGNPEAGMAVPYQDVEEEAWYADAVAWAAGAGIIYGRGGGIFGGGDTITRQELVTILWRFAGCPAPRSSALRFCDVSRVSSYALEAMGWAVDNCLISGRPSGALDPLGAASRAEIAQVMMKLQPLLQQAEGL